MSHAPFRQLGLLVAAFAAALGCAVPAAVDDAAVESAESALGESGTITFTAGFQQQVTGTVMKGKKVRIAYDASRLPSCRGELYGKPAWSIMGFWKIGDGPVRTFDAAGHSTSGAAPVLELDASGELQMWFQNTSRWGCSEFDSAFGHNYRFAVSPAAHEPGWMGDVRYAIERMTCDGICDHLLRPVTGPITYDTYARQRAAIRTITFEVWKDGVTNWDNPDLWKQLDVQVHSRVGSSGPFTSSYVPFNKRIGNNARYAIDLRPLDPVPGLFTITDPAQCPAFPLTSSAGYVSADVELYVTVNGVELRPEGGGTFTVRYANYEGLYAPCVK